MSSKYALAPEFRSLRKIPIPSSRLLLRAFNGLLALQRRGFQWSDQVATRVHSVEGEDGTRLPVTEIAPKGLDGDAPALIDYHGGGFFFSYASTHLEVAARYAVDARCRVFFPDYRLSINDPFPAALNDSWATLRWIHEQAATLGVEPTRVAVVGDSAGGALAAGVAQRALDHGSAPLCGQVLIYPVTDHETKTESARAFTDTPLWKTGSNRTMWKVYLRDTEYARGGGATVPPYAAPLHRSDFSGLPPAFVEVAEFDPLRDEGVAYADALEAAGVPVTLHRAPGAVHGYDGRADSPVAEAAYKERLSALQRFFGRD